MTIMHPAGELHRASPAPLYRQLQRLLRNAIYEERLGDGASILPERDLASEYGVSRITVRKAIKGLVEEGLLARRRRAGTIVTSRIEKNVAKLLSFSEEMIARGCRPSSKWIGRSSGVINSEEARSLGMPPGSTVYRFQRIRYADEMPTALEFSAIASHCLSGSDAVRDSLYAALEQTGCRPVHALQRMRAVPLSAAYAKLLDVNVGCPGLHVERWAFLRDGRTVEFTRSFYRGDTYDFVTELTDF